MLELDEQLISEVSTAVRAGEFPRPALVKLGVPGSTAGRWLKRAGEESQEDVDPDQSLFVRLQRAIEVAEAECESAWLAKWKAACDEGKRMAAISGWKSLLECRFPDRWGAKFANRQGPPEKPKSIEQAFAQLHRRGEDV